MRKKSLAQQSLDFGKSNKMDKPLETQTHTQILEGHIF